MGRLQESPQSLEGRGEEKPVLRGMMGTVPAHTVDMIIFAQGAMATNNGLSA